MYYENKINSLKDIFNTNNITLTDNVLIVDNTQYPIIDDVIILCKPQEYSNFIKERISIKIGN